MRTTLPRFAGSMLALFFLAVVPAMADAQQDTTRVPRTWTTRSGSYKAVATFAGFKDGVVTLHKVDGRVVELGIEKLCDADQQYIKEQTSPAHEPGAEPSQTTGSSQLEERCQELSGQITKSYKGKAAGGKATVAVVEFSDLSGGVTNLGRLLSEELTTKLFATGDYKVIERHQLNKVIAEHKLQLQGIVDPKSAKELGKILAVDAIVSGTIADLGDSLRVNARVISTESAEVLSVAAASVTKDKAIITLTGGGSGGAQSADASTGGNGQPVRLPFREDFSTYKDDEVPKGWGHGVKVRTGADQRRWLVASAKGQHPVGVNVDLSPNAYIEFEYGAELLESKNNGGDRVISGITLVDEAGAKYRIEWTIGLGGFDVLDGIYAQVVTLPGGASAAGRESGWEFPPSRQSGTLRIQKKGDTITVTVAGRKLTGNTRDFKRFKRFEVDAYRGSNTSMSFTNFRIGKLD